MQAMSTAGYLKQISISQTIPKYVFSAHLPLLLGKAMILNFTMNDLFLSIHLYLYLQHFPLLPYLRSNNTFAL